MPGCLAASPVHAFCTMPSNLGASPCSTAADLGDTESCCSRHHPALLFPYMCFCCQFLHWCWGHEQQHPSHPPPRPLPTSAQSLPLASVTTAEWNRSSELPFGLGVFASSAVVDGRLQLVTYVEDVYYDGKDPQYLLVGGGLRERCWMPCRPFAAPGSCFWWVMPCAAELLPAVPPPCPV